MMKREKKLGKNLCLNKFLFSRKLVTQLVLSNKYILPGKLNVSLSTLNQRQNLTLKQR